MKYRNNLSDHCNNSYFQIKKPFTIFIAVGLFETNTFIGSARALGTLYRQVELRPGSEVHDLSGGVFACLDGVAYRARIKLSEKHLFEKVYGVEEEIYPLDCLERIGNPVFKDAKYNVALPLVEPPKRHYGRGLDAIEI